MNPEKQQDLFGHTITIQSFTDPDVTYEIDTQARTCSCPAFQKSKKGLCKHLIAHNLIKGVDLKHPTNSQAISAFIKSYRLRWEEEACYWAAYLWVQQDQRFRLVRRLLMQAGEDNLSIPIQVRAQKTVNNWAHLDFLKVVREVMRACRTPNWWSQEQGHEYVHAFAMANASLELKTIQKQSWGALRKLFFSALRDQDLYRANLMAEAMWAQPEVWKEGPGPLLDVCQEMYALATKQENPEALKTLSLTMANRHRIGIEGNYFAQCMYRLCRGSLGAQVYPRVTVQEAIGMRDLVKYELAHKPRLMKPYFLDGIHTSGSDRRFAGTPRAMNGMCKAFRHYGRLDPADTWPSHFWKIE